MVSSGAPIDSNGLGASRPPARKLDSWKEIADYLDREVRTVQRWEKSENLPVHRHEHQKKSTVYAYTNELDEWRKNRQPKDDPEADAAFVPEPDLSEASLDPDSCGAIPTAQPLVAIAEVRPVDPRIQVTIDPPKVKRFAAVLAAAGILVLAGYRVYKWIKPTPSRVSVTMETARVGAKTRLVVLPFKNLSGDPKQDYFSAGLTDEMITRLGSLAPQSLGVIAAASSSALAGKPIAEIGLALDVKYALEGSVRRNGNHVRIDVRLIQVSDQAHLWADSYDRELDDILQVQDDVADAVASKIRLALSYLPVYGVETAKRTVNPEAYDAYLRGRFYWTNRGDLHKSLEAYQQAIQKDPQYALAYAGLANGYALLGQVPYDDLKPSDAKPKAKQAAEHALQLDPELSEAHTALANVAFSYDWDFETAEREFQRAVALGPNDPTPHLWYGHYFIVRNRLSQALEQNSHTLELDPVSPVFNTVRAQIEYSARDYNAAVAQGMRVTEQYPTYWLAYIWLGSAYREKKMYAQALEQFAKGRQLSGDQPVMIALYGHALAVSGDAAGARKVLTDLQHLAQSRYVSSLYFAAIHLGLGEKSQALDGLELAYKERNDYLAYLGVDPLADPLRSDPRFQQLLAKIGVQ